MPGKGVTCDCSVTGLEGQDGSQCHSLQAGHGHVHTEHNAAFEECLAVPPLHMGRWELPEFTSFTPTLKADRWSSRNRSQRAASPAPRGPSVREEETHSHQLRSGQVGVHSLISSTDVHVASIL